ncbi:MAG: hypothetical protein JRF54_03655 [Deltaproteobacteria bacterium]|nr:hypothetical protein [Deltaproteobacteria bacterium]
MSFLLLGHGSAALAQPDPASATPDEPAVISVPPQRGESLRLSPLDDLFPRGRPTRLLFRSSSEGIWFHLKSSSAADFSLDYRTGYPLHVAEKLEEGYFPICEAPCVATLPSGEHHFGLSIQGRDIISAELPVNIWAESVVHARYVDKGRMRRIGMWIAGLGMGVGSIMMLASADYDVFEHSNPRVFWSGFAVFCTSLMVGIPLAIREDEASIDVRQLEY